MDLLPRDQHAWLEASLDLAEAQREDQEHDARQAYETVLHAAERAGDERIAKHALLGRLELEWFEQFEGDWDQGLQEIESATWTTSGAAS